MQAAPLQGWVDSCILLGSTPDPTADFRLQAGNPKESDPPCPPERQSLPGNERRNGTWGPVLGSLRVESVGGECVCVCVCVSGVWKDVDQSSMNF